MNGRLKKVCEMYHTGCVKLTLSAYQHANLVLSVFALGILFIGVSDLASAQVEYIGGQAYEVSDAGANQSNFYRLLNGKFGSLIMVVSGLGAMVSAAMGAYKAAVGMLIVAIGSFGIRASVNVSLGYDDIRYSNATQ